MQILVPGKRHPCNKTNLLQSLNQLDQKTKEQVAASVIHEKKDAATLDDVNGTEARNVVTLAQRGVLAPDLVVSSKNKVSVSHGRVCN